MKELLRVVAAVMQAKLAELYVRLLEAQVVLVAVLEEQAVPVALVEWLEHQLQDAEEKIFL